VREAHRRAETRRRARRAAASRRSEKALRAEGRRLPLALFLQQIPDFLQQHFLPGRRLIRGLFLLALQAVDHLHHEEDRAGDDEEVDAGLEELAVLDGRAADLEREAAEIEAAH